MAIHTRLVQSFFSSVISGREIVGLVVLTGAAWLLLSGCASINPGPDYERTARIIAERTGVEDVYDPQTEAAIEGKVGELLDGGLTTDEAVRVALLNNKSFQAIFYDIGASRADVVQSGLLTNPSLSLSVRLPEGGGRSNLFNVKVGLMSILRDRRVATADLAESLGLSRYEESWTLTGTLPEPLLLAADVTPLVVLAMAERLDARLAESSVRSAEDEIRRQYLSIFPSVEIGLDGERPERRALPGRKILADTVRGSAAAGTLTAPTIQSRAERRLERRQIIDSLLGPSLAVTLPIWDQNQAGIAKARIEATRRRKQYEELLDRVAAEVGEALTSARSAREIVAFYQERGLPEARENVEAARRAYQAGRQSILALIEAQKSLIVQRRNCLDVQRDYAVALVQLERSVGGRLPLATPTTQPGRR